MSGPVARVDTSGTTAEVALEGDVDVTNVADLRAAFDQAVAHSPHRVIVQASDVTFLDSSALGAWVACRKRLGPNGELIVRAPSARVRRILEVTGLTRVFTVEG